MANEDNLPLKRMIDIRTSYRNHKPITPEEKDIKDLLIYIRIQDQRFTRMKWRIRKIVNGNN